MENYEKIYDLKLTILRYGSLYGKRANHSNFFRNVTRQALTNGRVKRKGNANEVRDYVNVKDAAASVEILGKEFDISSVMITGNQTMKLCDLLGTIREILHNQVTIECLDQENEEHCQITPCSVEPKVPKKYVSKDYYDLGQGILDCIYDVCKQLIVEMGQAGMNISMALTGRE